eukprot:TRINITY_DN9318_c0_g2_i1.p1 TRINITY_DN9318_c0_g2~~TRINITY_DN9318_c0_g2_i1.p1  ORF type:complete len:487 (+),score=169.53 TRINITY_DN9318_c0_g2_i1:87-1463(+)
MAAGGSESDSEDAPPLVAAAAAPVVAAAKTGSAGAASGLTAYELQQLAEARAKAGEGRPGIDWKVPVTIVTGFLGSGKSTLVRRLLQERHDLRIAVMVNEFGAAAEIEKAMTVAQGGAEEDDWVEMSNGCMCCKFKDKAVEALEGLVKRRGRFDAIVIETSGLADPAPLIAMFWQDVQLESPVELNGVATLVDAKLIPGYLGRGCAGGSAHGSASSGGEPEGGFVEATQQLALADRVVVNKVDLVDAAALDSVTAVVRSINPEVAIDYCSYGKGVDLSQLLTLRRPAAEAAGGELDRLRGLRTLVPDPTAAASRQGQDHSHSHGGAPCGTGCAEVATARHTPGIGAVSVEAPGSLRSMEAVAALMKAALWDTRDAREQQQQQQPAGGAQRPAGPTVLRLKARLLVADSGPQIVQAVGDLFDMTPCGPAAAGTADNQLVVIGRDLGLLDWRALLLAHIG